VAKKIEVQLRRIKPKEIKFRIKRLLRTAGRWLIRRTKLAAPKKNSIFAGGLISLI
jgi:hypothetical protein